MRTLDLDAIEARCEAATEGPWTGAVEPTQAVPECDDVDLHGYVRDIGGREIAFLTEWHDDHEANATFIAHARTDLPALVSRVRELEAENKRLRNIAAAVALPTNIPDFFTLDGADRVAALGEIERRANLISCALPGDAEQWFLNAVLDLVHDARLTPTTERA